MVAVRRTKPTGGGQLLYITVVYRESGLSSFH